MRETKQKGEHECEWKSRGEKLWRGWNAEEAGSGKAEVRELWRMLQWMRQDGGCRRVHRRETWKAGGTAGGVADWNSGCGRNDGRNC